jgi:tetratricopeptide (TPR) repeat protein
MARILDALGIHPRLEAALLLSGFSFYQQGRLLDAKNIFEGLALLDTKNPYVHGILGSVYQQEGKEQDAILSYSTAISLFEKDVNSLVNRGEVFLRLGKFQQAAKDFASAIRFDPDSKNPAANRARLLILMTQDALKVVNQKGIEAINEERERLKSTSGLDVKND